MPLSVEALPSLATAEDRLVALVDAARAEPLARINLLVGSNLQGRYLRRHLAAALGPLANLHIFTPVDLAAAVRQLTYLPARHALPDGADAALVQQILVQLKGENALGSLDPGIPGLAESLLSTLKDVREAAVEPTALRAAFSSQADPKLADLANVLERFERAARPLLDRAALYQDALRPEVDAAVFREALGGGPLLIAGIYDMPELQRRLVERCARAADVRMLVVAPPLADFAYARRFYESFSSTSAGAQLGLQLELEEETALRVEALSAPSRQAEAEEIARRILDLARTHSLHFNEIAVLHRLGPGADDLFASTLERAQIPVYRAGGRPLRHTSAGRGVLVLLDLLVEEPARPKLLEFLSNPALRPELPPGVAPTPILWERHSRGAGLVRGWERFAAQLDVYIASLRDNDAGELSLGTAESFAAVAGELRDAAQRFAVLKSWASAADAFLQLADAFLAAGEDAGDGRDLTTEALAAMQRRVAELSILDQVGVPFAPEAFHQVARRALRRAVLNDSGALTAGVFVGGISAARSLRFDAVFLAECAERILPAVVRPDPLLLDGEREAINARAERPTLSVRRRRLDEDRMLFRLIHQSARRFLTVSWARRTSSTGAPRLPSTFALEEFSRDPGRLASVDDLDARGGYRRLPARLAGAAPSRTAASAGEWDSALRALDETDLHLALLEGSGTAARMTLRHLWPGIERYERARARRADPEFSEFDGIVGQDLPAGLLDRPLSPTALETYATCPYRYFLRYVLRVGAVAEPADVLEITPLERGALVHRILERWVNAWLPVGEDGENGKNGAAATSWADYVEDAAALRGIVREEFQRAQQQRLFGAPASAEVAMHNLEVDLDQVRRREAAHAADGWEPRRVEWRVPPTLVALEDGTTLAFSGRVDRVDRAPDGRLHAIDYKTGVARLGPTAYRGGAGLQLPVYLRALAAEYEIDPRRASAEFFYVTRQGGFQRAALDGETLAADSEFDTALTTIADGIRAGRFFPHPGTPRGQFRRPNCGFCDYAAACSTDVDRRFDHKKRQDQDTVRDFLTLQAKR